MNNKLAIVGAEPRTRSNAPWDDTTFDIWAISNWANAPWMKRSDAVIEIHKPAVYMNHPNDANYWTWLQAATEPVVYMQKEDVMVPGSELYPLDGILKMLADMKVDNQDVKPLNSSIAYAIALAVYRGYKTIDIYGVEMSNSSEYRSQQPMFAFWTGFAAGRGIALNINCTQALFVQPLYGYEDMLNNEKLHGYIDGLKEQQAESQKQNYMIDGALQLARQLLDD